MGFELECYIEGKKGDKWFLAEGFDKNAKYNKTRISELVKIVGKLEEETNHIFDNGSKFMENEIASNPEIRNTINQLYDYEEELEKLLEDPPYLLTETFNFEYVNLGFDRLLSSLRKDLRFPEDLSEEFKEYFLWRILTLACKPNLKEIDFSERYEDYAWLDVKDLVDYNWGNFIPLKIYVSPDLVKYFKKPVSNTCSLHPYIHLTMEELSVFPEELNYQDLYFKEQKISLNQKSGFKEVWYKKSENEYYGEPLISALNKYKKLCEKFDELRMLYWVYY